MPDPQTTPLRRNLSRVPVALALAALILAALTACSPRPSPIEPLAWRALEGDIPAMLELALRCERGEGLPADQAQATRWYLAAAERGSPLAQYRLGLGYLAGRGASVDEAEGLRWLRLSAGQGFAPASRALETLAR
jgi:TPR repeat protein